MSIQSSVTVFQVARWFTEKNGGAIPSKKLQKLCYYTQAWSYAMRGDAPFFDGTFEAWVHGPVNRQLWLRFRDISYREITLEDFSAEDAAAFSTEDTEFLTLIWNTYGEFSGYQLEELSHTEAPWREQRKGMDDYDPGYNVISTNTMRDYYRSLLSRDGVI